MAVNLPDISPLGLKQINTGISPDDGQGDFFYIAFEKHNFNMQQLAATIAPKLVSNRIYYVSAIGNDSNSGLLASVPFLTVAKAVSTAHALNVNLLTVTIKIMDGVYNEAVVVRSNLAYTNPSAKFSIIFEGNTLVPSSVTFNLNTLSGFNFLIENTARVEIKGIRFLLDDAAFSATQSFITVRNNAVCYVRNCTFGQMSVAAINASHLMILNSTLFINGSYNISGGARNHIRTYDGIVEVDNTSGVPYDVTVSNGPVFESFLLANASSTITLASSQISYTGAAAGFNRVRDFDARINFNNNLPSGLSQGTINQVTTGAVIIESPLVDDDSSRASSTQWVRSYTNTRISALEATLAALGSGLQDAINGLGVVPRGGIISYGGSAAPAGFALCNGQAISRSTHSDLFGIIGTIHGIGDGTSTFELPDLRGRIPMGAGTGSGLTARSLGAWIGSETVVLANNQMPFHSHVVVDPGHNHVLVNVAHTHSIFDPGHAHSLPGQTYDTDASEGSDGDGSAYAPRGNFTLPSGTGQAIYATTTANYNVATGSGISVANSGASAAHPNVQPCTIVNFIIKL